MTKKIIEKELRNLITQNNSGIAALYAPWGNGKTYFWKKFIQELSKDPSNDTFKGECSSNCVSSEILT